MNEVLVFLKNLKTALEYDKQIWEQKQHESGTPAEYFKTIGKLELLSILIADIEMRILKGE